MKRIVILIGFVSFLGAQETLAHPGIDEALRYFDRQIAQ